MASGVHWLDCNYSRVRRTKFPEAALAMVRDFTAVFYLAFMVCNIIVFALIVGFFTGTGIMEEGIEPCVHLVTAEASKCVTERFEIEREALGECIKQIDEYVLSNSDGHWFKILLPMLVIAVLNILIFSGFWYVRAMKQLKIRDALSADQQYKLGVKGKNESLADEQDYPRADQDVQGASDTQYQVKHEECDL